MTQPGPAHASMPILVVAEDGDSRAAEWLQSAGFRTVLRVAPDGLEAGCRTHHPDLVVVAADPAEALIGEARRAAGAGVPVVAIAAGAATALGAGASDVLRLPLDGDEAAAARLANLLEIRRLRVQMEDQTLIFEDKVRERTEELEHAQLEILDRLAVAAEYRDDATRDHTRRVGDSAWLLAQAIAGEEGLEPRQVDLIRRAAPLHDIGKIGVPDAVLLKAGSLSEDETEKVRIHTVVGARILWGSRLPLLRFAQEIALCHHERWDGSGYPAGFSGEQIPVTARITAVADVFDALTHARPYKEAWPLDRALDELATIGGAVLDPRMAKAFSTLVADGALETIEWS